MTENAGVIVTHNDRLEPFDVNTDLAKTAVDEAFSHAENEAYHLRGDLKKLQKDLLNLIDNFDPEVISTAFSKIQYDKTNFPSWKEFADLVLNAAWPKDTPVKPKLEDIGEIDWSIVEPPTPKTLETYFSFTPGEYSSKIRATLISNTLRDLVSGGNGLSESAYNAILNREKRLRLKNQSETLRDAMHAIGESGISITDRNGQATAVISSIFRAQIHADQNSLDNIVAQDFEYSVRAKEFSHNLALEIEKLLSGEFDASESRRFEASRAEYELLIQTVEQNITLYREKWQGIVAKTQYVVSLIEGKTSINKNKTDMYVAEWDGRKSATEAIASENSAKLQQRGLEISNQQARFSTVAIARQENRADAEFELRQKLAELENEIRVAGINLDGYKSGADLKAGVLGNLAKIVAQVTASTIGIMNTSASMSFSGSDSQSKSTTQSKSLSESYSAELGGT